MILAELSFGHRVNRVSDVVIHDICLGRILPLFLKSAAPIFPCPAARWWVTELRTHEQGLVGVVVLLLCVSTFFRTILHNGCPVLGAHGNLRGDDLFATTY